MSKAPDDCTYQLSGPSSEQYVDSINCRNASISCSESALLHIGLLSAETIQIHVDHAATVLIDKLACAGIQVRVARKGLVDIKNIECAGELHIGADQAGTLGIGPGVVNTVMGDINNASMATCEARITHDKVGVGNSSYWIT